MPSQPFPYAPVTSQRATDALSGDMKIADILATRAIHAGHLAQLCRLLLDAFAAWLWDADDATRHAEVPTTRRPPSSLPIDPTAYIHCSAHPSYTQSAPESMHIGARCFSEALQALLVPLADHLRPAAAQPAWRLPSVIGAATEVWPQQQQQQTQQLALHFHARSPLASSQVEPSTLLATAAHHVVNLVAALLRVVDIGSSVPAASLGKLLPAVGHALAAVACTLAAAGAALAIGPPLGTHCCIARNAVPPHTHAPPFPISFLGDPA